MTGRNGMAGLTDGRHHITEEQFCDWMAGEMSLHEEEGFLGHIGSCTFCAQQFAEYMEAPKEFLAGAKELSWDLAGSKEPHRDLAGPEKLLLEPPGYLKDEILQRTQQVGVQVTVHVKEKSRQMQLFMYSLKVGLAVMTSILLLMVTANIQDLQSESVRSWKAEQAQQRQEKESREERMSITDTLNQKSGEVSSFLNDMSSGLFRMK